ncbi:hypothetical protein AMECASPLE_027842 [Ameca splendens]|uniref:Uncharacterized protein n=1 Tax=Ameca splendens TaxID=208324 RepID=A0ABV0XU58_9TELE
MRRLQTHGSCSLPPSPSSQGELSDPTQRSIHLPVHPPSFASSRSGVFSPRKKGQFSNWRSQELVGSLPANHRCCGEGLIPPTSLPSLSLNNSSIDPLTQFLVPVYPSIYCLKINCFKTFSLPLMGANNRLLDNCQVNSPYHVFVGRDTSP